MTKPLLSVKDLSLCYYTSKRDLKSVLVDLIKRKSSSKKIDVLKNVSFDLFPGEILCLGGSNGVGKSSLLYAICGKMVPETGSIDVNGEVAAFFGFSNFSPYETGYSALKFLTIFHGGSTESFDDNISQYSALSGLPVDLIKTQPFYTYSQGMKTRLLAAFSLFHHFQINLFDETLSNGDQRFNDIAFEKITHNTKNGASYIIVTHSKLLWSHIADFNGRFLILGNEGVVYDGKDMKFAWDAYNNSQKYKISAT